MGGKDYSGLTSTQENKCPSGDVDELKGGLEAGPRVCLPKHASACLQISCTCLKSPFLNNSNKVNIFSIS